ncbi:MAG: hemolysin III family protein [Bacillota bacterium]|nr:hemolysin III family protein [Bacillota bacterium]
MTIYAREHKISVLPRDPASAISHLLGFILAVVGTVFLVIEGYSTGGALYGGTFLVFGITMMLLYLASATYHWLDLSEHGNLLLRKLDHAMIYVLIAGTYTPLCVIALNGLWSTGMLLAIWSLALGGIGLTLFYFSAPRWLTTGIYLFMGWLLVIALIPLSRTLPAAGFAWLFAGGISYTVGGIIYGRKRSFLHFPGFGFHEIFHIFVLGGTICHYLLMLLVLVHL